jgi:hypothetical protein
VVVLYFTLVEEVVVLLRGLILGQIQFQSGVMEVVETEVILRVLLVLLLLLEQTDEVEEEEVKVIKIVPLELERREVRVW